MKRTAATLILLALSACNQEHRTDAEFADVQVPTDLLASDEARARGREIFENKCALCHGEEANGRGRRRKGLSSQPPNFQSEEWRNSVSPKYIFQVVSEGKRGTSMPGWPTLSTKQRWDVVAYVLSVAEDGP
ncbi:MAG: cytochrome c [Myxococcales bacterium]|jgi:mono/diheme cytochrome c family protein